MMKRILVILVLLGALVPLQVFADSARAWLDRDTMQLGETVTLNIEVDGGTSTAPDFSVLDNDFKSLGTQSSRQFSMTNGQATAKTIWAIGLEPKRAGTLEIPALAVGSASTTPLRLTVLPAAVGGQGKAGDNVYVEVSAEPLTPYVQQQVRYVVKLYYAVDLTEGALDEPVADGVVVQKLGRDRQYNAVVGERRYNVLERRYALIAERSGRLTMPPLAFRGSTLDSADPTGFFRRGRAISARSDAVELDVRAKPAEWGAAPWLPAASFTISDETSLPDEVPVGEPITRTVRLRAQGLGFEQLPELAFEAPPGSEIYPDKPDTQTRDDGSWLFGERTRKFAVVATQPGKLVLPAMQVDWWDTTQDRRVTAVLPAHEINVVAAAGAASSPPAAPTPALHGSADAPPASIMYPSPDGDSSVRICVRLHSACLHCGLPRWSHGGTPGADRRLHWHRMQCRCRRIRGVPHSCARARPATSPRPSARCSVGHAASVPHCATSARSPHNWAGATSVPRSTICCAFATRARMSRGSARDWRASSATASHGPPHRMLSLTPRRCRRCIATAPESPAPFGIARRSLAAH